MPNGVVEGTFRRVMMALRGVYSMYSRADVMACMRSGNGKMLHVEQQRTSQATLWQSTSSSASCTNSSITPSSSVPTYVSGIIEICTVCRCRGFLAMSPMPWSVVMLSLPVPCLFSVCIQVFPTPLLSSLSLPRSPHACLCFHLRQREMPSKAGGGEPRAAGLRAAGPRAVPWTLVPSLCVTLLWMPRCFVLPVTINSDITRLNTRHLQARGFYQRFHCTFLYSVSVRLRPCSDRQQFT